MAFLSKQVSRFPYIGSWCVLTLLAAASSESAPKSHNKMDLCSDFELFSLIAAALVISKYLTTATQNTSVKTWLIGLGDLKDLSKPFDNLS